MFQGQKVRDIMTKGALTIDPGSSVLQAAAIISPLGYLMVIRDGRAVGIITEQDIVSKVTAKNADPSKVLVKDVMSAPVMSVRADAGAEDAAGIMTRYRFRRMAVANDDGTFAGVVTVDDLARLLAKESSSALNALFEPRVSIPADGTA